MAKICSQCNTYNADENVFCMGCGASLSDATFVADSKKGKRKIQEQEPVARRILSIILIAATLLCLFTTLQYACGSYPVRIVYTENEEYIRELNSLEQIFEYLFNVPDDCVRYSNSWDNVFILLDNIENINFENEIYTHSILIILSQCCNTACYFILTILLGIALLFTFRKSPKAMIFVLIAAIAGLLAIVIGYLLGYFLITYDDYYWSDYYLIKEHMVLQKTVLMLLPLFGLAIPLAFMLPKKVSDNEKNADDESVYIEVNE